MPRYQAIATHGLCVTRAWIRKGGRVSFLQHHDCRPGTARYDAITARSLAACSAVTPLARTLYTTSQNGRDLIRNPTPQNSCHLGNARSAKRSITWVPGIRPSFLYPQCDGCNYRDLGAARARSRAPGPPPFPSINSTPAASKARRTARSLAAVIEVWSSALSARLIVLRPRAAARARSSADHLTRARAARIWAPERAFGFI
jgi:hypothetical protein